MKTQLITLTLVALFAATAIADDNLVEQAKKIRDTNAKSIVRVRAVTQTSQEGFGISFGNADKVTQVPATFIDDSGMALVPYSSLDPSAGIQVLAFNVGGEEQKIESKTKFKSFDFVLADGTVLPAKIVVTDKKLDVAVVAVEKPLDDEAKKKIAAVAIKSDTKVGLLDRVITLGRLNPTLDSQISVGVGRVNAVVEKPRTTYVGIGAKPGYAVFTESGELLGISTMRIPNITSIGGAFDATPIVVPGKYLAEVVSQAKERMKSK